MVGSLAQATHLSAADAHRLQHTLQRRVLRLFQRRGVRDDHTVGDMLTCQAGVQVCRKRPIHRRH